MTGDSICSRGSSAGRPGEARTLATIYVTNRDNGQWLNVNERMVTLGHAWVARNYYAHLPEARQQQLDRLEDWARSRRVGLWRAPNPTPPWQWRRC